MFFVCFDSLLDTVDSNLPQGAYRQQDGGFNVFYDCFYEN